MRAPHRFVLQKDHPDDRGSSGPPASSSSRSLSPTEIATIAHVSALLLLSTWYFAGGSASSRLLISSWGSLATLIIFAVARNRAAWRDGSLRPLRWLWPLAAFNVLVLASCLNPSFAEKIFAGERLLAHTGPAYAQLPSTAHVRTSLQHLWLFDALYLSGFNLALVIRQRRVLRGLLWLACGNAMLLSVFGTFQKLLSDGLFFGLVKSPNARFFATFVYGNHWAAFVVLLVAACIGLLFYHVRRLGDRPITHSPVMIGVLGLALMAVTPVICGSRAGSAMVLGLLLVCVTQTLLRILRSRRTQHRSTAGLVGAVVGCALLTISSAFWLGRDALRERWTDTQEQLQTSLLRTRLELYRDTGRLVAAEPIFGWGLGSYGKVFLLIRPRPLAPNRQYEHSYVDAHSDWLQALAEVGLVGAALLGLNGLLPLLGLRRRHFRSSLVLYLFGGCGLILLYALIEFPFGNPAVVLTWWICFFCAVQYARLQDVSAARHHPDASSSPFAAD